MSSSLLKTLLGDSTKKSQQKAIEATLATLTNPAIPLEKRQSILSQLTSTDDPASRVLTDALLTRLGQENAESEYQKLREELAQLIEEYKAGPLRPATFEEPLVGAGMKEGRAIVRMPNGDQTYPIIEPTLTKEQFLRGESVILDSQARVLLFRAPPEVAAGEMARLERVVDGQRVLASVREQEPHIFRISATLAEKIGRGEVLPGANLLVCSRRSMAFDSIPMPDGHSHYRWLVRDGVPDVVAERDIGQPPAFIEEIREHLRLESEMPQVGRKYRLRRSKTKLLTGVPGTGKSLAIQAVWHDMYRHMEQLTGVPMSELPPRVLKFRAASLLDKWLGNSDKNVDRFFNDVEELAGQKFIAPDGTEWELPLLVIGEEVDGLARVRGAGDPIYDRIQTTALERLDMNCTKLKEKLVIFLFTTNVPHLLDPAFLRRAGGTIEHFGRLGRRGFAAVLEKHIGGLPLAGEHEGNETQACRRLVRQMTDWLFAPSGQDAGQVELTYVGSATPVTKFRRDFLTGALVDRAVQQTASEVCRREWLGTGEPGLNAELLMKSFHAQIKTIVDQLTQHNVESYLSLPDGVRVGQVRRVEQPALQHFQLT